MQALILLPYTNVKLKGTTVKERQLLWWRVRIPLYFCSGIKNKQSLANLLIPDTFLSAIEKNHDLYIFPVTSFYVSKRKKKYMIQRT